MGISSIRSKYTPAGANREIQINDNGVLGSSSGFVLNSSGYVGIGVNNPLRGLHLEGDSGISAIRLKTTGGEWDFAPFWSAFDDGNFALNRVSGSGNLLIPSGNVGIGEPSPATILHISQGGEPPGEGMLILEANSSIRQLRIQPPTTADNGFFDILGGSMRFMDDGAEIFRYGPYSLSTSSGIKVGIGLDDPSQLLHLSGAPATGGIRLDEQSNTAYQAYLTFLDTSGNFGLDVNGGGRLRFATGGSENLTILSSGNVGIGTDAPSSLAHVYNGTLQIGSKTGDTSLQDNPTAIRIAAIPNESTEWGGIQWYREFSDFIGAAITAARPGSAESETDLIFKTTNSGTDAVERMRIDSSGNVGIGEPSPASLLTLKGGNILLEYNSTGADDGHGIFFHTTTNGWGEAASHAAIYGKRVDASNGYLRFDTRSGGTTAERMRLNENGNLGIGDDSPAYPLVVKRDLDTGGVITRFFNSDPTYSQTLDISFDSAKDITFEGGSGAGGLINNFGTNGYVWQIGGSEKARITSDGDFSIGGDATPSARLNVTDEYDGDGDIAYFENTHSNGGAFLTIKQNETNAQPAKAAGIKLGTKGNINWYQGILRRGGSDHFNTWSLNTSNDNNTVEAKFAVTTDGRVGINVTRVAQFDNVNTTASIVLDARTTSSGAPGISITDVSGVGGGGRGSGYSFRTITNDTGKVITEVGRVTAHKDNNVQGEDGGWMAFYTKPNGSSISERMRIHSDGAVSIGNTSLNSTYGILSLSNGNGVGNTALYIQDNGGIGYSLGIVDGSQAFSISEGTNLSSQKRFEIDTNGGTIIGGADIRTLYAAGDYHSLLYMEGTPRNDGGNWREWPGISILANNASTGGAAIDLGHAKGTALGNTTAIVDNDSLGALYFAGADGTAIQRGAVIQAQANGDWSGTNRGTDIVFQTAINGTTAYPSERMRIASQGGIGSVLIGKTTADAHNKGDNTNLEVEGSVSSRTYTASNVGTGTWVNSGFTVGNQMRAYIITIFGRPDASNTYSTAMYVLVSSAYSKVLTQLGTPSSHFGNGELEAQLDSNSAATVNFQVRWAFNSGNAQTSDVHTQVLRLM